MKWPSSAIDLNYMYRFFKLCDIFMFQKAVLWKKSCGHIINTHKPLFPCLILVVIKSKNGRTGLSYYS